MSKPKKPKKPKHSVPEWPMSPADGQMLRAHIEQWMDGVMEDMGLGQPASKAEVIEFSQRSDDKKPR